MITIVIVTTALVLHLLCCIAMWTLAGTGKLKIPRIWAIIACFLPFWGEIGAAALHRYRSAARGSKKRTYMDEAGFVSDIYQNVTAHEEDHGVIPLEEALRINDSAVKRTMIMDILNEQPDQYIGLLKEARSNDDAEVVHYATTAMSELSKDYDLQLQSIEAEYAANPDDVEVMDRYTHFLEEYIGKELAQGQFLTMQRIQYGRLLQKQIDREPTLERYLKQTDNSLELKNYGEAAGLLDIMEERWADQESVLLLRIRCLAEQGNGNEIHRLIRTIPERGIYLTSEGKHVVEFWSKGGEAL